MRAIVVHSLGAPDVLRTGHRPLPEPGPGEVLVRIHAIGVNFSDTERRRGFYDPPALPWTPGNEAAGVVEALGAGTDPVWSGRIVDPAPPLGVREVHPDRVDPDQHLPRSGLGEGPMSGPEHIRRT